MMLVIPLAVNRDTNDFLDLCCVIQTSMNPNNCFQGAFWWIVNRTQQTCA